MTRHQDGTRGAWQRIHHLIRLGWNTRLTRLSLLSQFSIFLKASQLFYWLFRMHILSAHINLSNSVSHVSQSWATVFNIDVICVWMAQLWTLVLIFAGENFLFLKFLIRQRTTHVIWKEWSDAPINRQFLFVDIFTPECSPKSNLTFPQHVVINN